MASETNEFYIGWQAEAPACIARKVRSAVLAALMLVSLVGALAVMNQGGFAKSTFEFGQVTEMEGILVKTPAPFLQVFRGNDVEGKPVFQNILLVAPGKHGAMEMLLASEAELGHSLEGKLLKIKGFLIYHDGKTLMEVERMEDLTEENSPQTDVPKPIKLGSGALTGEITDPKCLFGVMNPGEGKPHRSCAARCIAGGIPPVLKTVSTDGQTQYYLLAGEQGQPVNDEILPYVGDVVLVCGNIYKLGDWLVLYKDAAKKPWRAGNYGSVELPLCK